MKIAIIGSGISGLYTAIELQRKWGNKISIDLYEKNPVIGGHTAPIKISETAHCEFYVDTAFLIFNKEGYPHFNQLLHSWGLTQKISRVEMSSSFSDEKNNFHYLLSHKPGKLLSQSRQLFSLRFLHLLFEIVLFKRAAFQNFISRSPSDQTLQSFLQSFSPELARNFIYPLCASIWSIPPEELMNTSLKNILQFFYNHGILQNSSQRTWSTLEGSAQVYLEKFRHEFKGKIYTRNQVFSIKKNMKKFSVETQHLQNNYDCTFICTDAKQALAMLNTATKSQFQCLSPWKYKTTKVYLHQDATLMPKNHKLWGSWNTSWRADQLLISYYLNKIQPLPTEKDYFLTLMPDSLRPPQNVIKNFSYAHPIFDQNTLKTQKLISEAFSDGLFLANSFTGFGFHEDGINSSIEALKLFEKWSNL